jgi:filamentous hemagglutinin family protein
LAQITPDNTLGNERSQVTPDQVIRGVVSDRIDGGAIRGINLFHSFEQFNINEGRGAYFANPIGIENILSRVTGSHLSRVTGTLGVLGNATLFFINPNGIIFGPTASLDMQGSFIASTASSIRLADGTDFSAVFSQNTSLLTMSAPLGLQFGENPGEIVVQGSGHNLSYSDLGSTIWTDSPGLQVQPGRTLGFVGGDIVLEGGNLRAESGRIQLGSAAEPGLVSLTPTNSGFVLGYAGISNFGDIQLSGKASVDTSGESGGEIRVQARRLSVRGGSSILSITQGTGLGGDFIVNTSELVELLGESADGQYASSLFTETQGTGSLGELRVTTGRLVATDGAYLSNYSYSEGRAGNLTIQASNSIKMIGAGLFASGFYVGADSVADTGNLTVTTRRLVLENGAQVRNVTFGSGSSGDLIVVASDLVNLRGESTLFSSGLFTQSQASGAAGNLTVNTRRLNVRDGAQISASAFGSGSAGTLTITAQDIELVGTSPTSSQFPSGLFTQVNPDATGDGGNLRITTERLILQGGARISAATFGRGRGGTITIRASDFVELSGISTDGQIPSGLVAATVGAGAAGNLQITTELLSIRDGALLSNSTFGQGRGGNIRIRAGSLSLTNAASIASQSGSQGRAGDISVNVRDTLQLNNSAISTAAIQSTGGAIDIKAEDIHLVGNSDIATSVLSGRGDGGSITLTAADSIIAFDDSDTFAFAQDGRGGNITFRTPAFFGGSYQPDSADADPDTLQGNDRVDINASGAVAGVITLPDVSFIQNSLADLPETAIDADRLIANSCIARTEQGGTFLITGSGGLPERPGNAIIAPYPTGVVRSIPGRDPASEESIGEPQPETHRWQPGDAIVEPQGVYRLSDGRLVMSRACSP